jgi:hypothetical protein
VIEAFQATRAPSGSDIKLEIIAERLRLGLPLFHDEDRTPDSVGDGDEDCTGIRPGGEGVPQRGAIRKQIRESVARRGVKKKT